MRKVFLSVLLVLCVAAGVHAANDGSSGSNTTSVKVPNPAIKPIGNQNMPQAVKGNISPSVTVSKPGASDVWEAGKSYTVEWEARLLSPGSSGTVTLSVMVPTPSNCQPVTNIPLNGKISYKVPYAGSKMGISPHGKFAATLSVKFIDKVTNKEYKDGKVIFVQYP